MAKLEIDESYGDSVGVLGGTDARGLDDDVVDDGETTSEDDYDKDHNTNQKGKNYKVRVKCLLRK